MKCFARVLNDNRNVKQLHWGESCFGGWGTQFQHTVMACRCSLEIQLASLFHRRASLAPFELYLRSIFKVLVWKMVL